MMGFFMKLLMARQVKIEKGEFRLFNQNVTVLPASFIVALTKYFMRAKDRKRSLSDFYFMSWAISFDFMERFSEKFKVKTFEDRYKLGMDVVAMSGLGDYKTIKWVKGKLSHVYVMNNPIARFFQPSKVPVDYFYSGVTAGGGMIVHKLKKEHIFHCVETECHAMNGKRCVFVSATEEMHKKMGTWDKFLKDIDLEYILPKQMEFFKNYKKFRKGDLSVLLNLI